ncbi:MAG: MEDS domain-containing protein [Candidatus Riflebacteria bacterium]|nr:MEDS domain-containing protein [Candidatus Riflebacteria bacterium]
MGRSHPTRALGDLSPGDHLCLLYETDEEHRTIMVPYLQLGLERHEKVFYITDERSAGKILEYLGETGTDVETYQRRGQLTIFSHTDTYLRDGSFDPTRMIALLEAATRKAIAEGYAALRVTGEMTWALRGSVGSDRLIEYEALLNEFFPGSRALAICQYDRRRFGPGLLMDVLRTHPVAVIGSELLDNVYYIPPREFLADDREATVLNRCIETLRERKAAEQELAAQKAELETILDAAPLLIFYKDRENRLIRVNRALAEITGLPKGQIEGRSVAEVYPDDPDRYWQDDLQVIASGQPRRHIIEPLQTAAGLRWVRTDKIPFRDPRGEVIGVIGFAEDISEQKQAQENLRESEERFRAITAGALDGIIMMDDAGNAVHWNAAAERILGWSEEEALGKNVHELLAPKRHLEAHREAFVRFRSSGEGPVIGKTLEWTALRKDAAEIPVELSVSALKVRGQWHAVGIIRDITERRRVEDERRATADQRQQAQRLESLGVLAGGIAHDFNNLLYAILGNAELGRLDLPRESPVQEYLKVIETAVRRGSALCRQLLAYAGKSLARVKPLDLSQTIEAARATLDAAVSGGVSLTFNLGRDLPTVEADPDQVQQVAMSFVTNAHEAIGDRGGFIVVSTGSLECDRTYLARCHTGADAPCPGRYAYLEVTDTGCGMDAETRARIFEPFFTTKFTGRGLGLAAVLGIVGSHGGAIRVTSEVGVGTTVRVLFPERQAPVEHPATRVPEKPSPQLSGTILVVDDEPTVLSVTCRLLMTFGLQVLAAPGGEEALDLFRRRSTGISGILLDMAMPGMDGVQTLRELIRIRPDVPVIICSGYAEEKVIGSFQGLPAAGFLRKPFSIKELRALLEKTLRH